MLPVPHRPSVSLISTTFLETLCPGSGVGVLSLSTLRQQIVFVFSRRRRIRMRASSTSDADFLASLTQLMQNRGALLLSPPPRLRSSSSLQRSLSSSPSRQELRDGSGGGAAVPQGRCLSPSSFSSSPPRHPHPQDRTSGPGQWGHSSTGRGPVPEVKAKAGR